MNASPVPRHSIPLSSFRATTAVVLSILMSVSAALGGVPARDCWPQWRGRRATRG